MVHVALLVHLAAGWHTPALSARRRLASPQCNLLNDIVEEVGRTNQIAERPVMFAEEEEGSSFDFRRWEMHRSSSRYGRLLFGLLFGITTRRISPTVAAVVLFSGIVDAYNDVSARQPPPRWQSAAA
eukprot:3261516-Prymnesium_polylepis.1